MAEKDITQKILEAYNDVFSDIVNVLLFQGRQVLKEDELEEQAPRSYYKADGKVHETERDVAKIQALWQDGYDEGMARLDEVRSFLAGQ